MRSAGASVRTFCAAGLLALLALDAAAAAHQARPEAARWTVDPEWQRAFVAASDAPGSVFAIVTCEQFDTSGPLLGLGVPMQDDSGWRETLNAQVPGDDQLAVRIAKGSDVEVFLGRVIAFGDDMMNGVPASFALIAPTPAQLQAIRRGDSITLALHGRTVTLTLAGSSAALDALPCGGAPARSAGKSAAGSGGAVLTRFESDGWYFSPASQSMTLGPNDPSLTVGWFGFPENEAATFSLTLGCRAGQAYIRFENGQVGNAFPDAEAKAAYDWMYGVSGPSSVAVVSRGGVETARIPVAATDAEPDGHVLTVAELVAILQHDAMTIQGTKRAIATPTANFAQQSKLWLSACQG